MSVLITLAHVDVAVFKHVTSSSRVMGIVIFMQVGRPWPVSLNNSLMFPRMYCSKRYHTTVAAFSEERGNSFWTRSERSYCTSVSLCGSREQWHPKHVNEKTCERERHINGHCVLCKDPRIHAQYTSRNVSLHIFYTHREICWFCVCVCMHACVCVCAHMHKEHLDLYQ